MVSPERIQALADRIGSLFHPEVVMPANERDRARATEIRGAIHSGFPMDLLVYDPLYLEKRYDMEDWFVRDMVERGRVLYESNHAGVG